MSQPYAIYYIHAEDAPEKLSDTELASYGAAYVHDPIEVRWEGRTQWEHVIGLEDDAFIPRWEAYLDRADVTWVRGNSAPQLPKY